jgi:hypothetical protein
MMSAGCTPANASGPDRDGRVKANASKKSDLSD